MSNDQPPLIYAAMAAVLRDCPAIGKNLRNMQQNFAFRGIDDIMDGLNPILAKHGVFFVPDVEEIRPEVRQTKQGSSMWTVFARVRFRFYASDGSYVEGTMYGEGSDLGDKATSKAMTMAEKSMLVQAFAISIHELDPDATSTETQPPSVGSVSQASRPPHPPSVGNGPSPAPLPSAGTPAPAGAPAGGSSADPPATAPYVPYKPIVTRCSSLGIGDDLRHRIIHHVTRGRTTSAKELTKDDADGLKRFLDLLADGRKPTGLEPDFLEELKAWHVSRTQTPSSSN